MAPHDPYLCWHTVGLLEQWLIEGNYTEEEALTQSIDMLAAGIDTVSNYIPVWEIERWKYLS